ncbi:hypothetical protein A6302_02657 [Methylobrevis pamukkalensis]|uniref:Uncharacterized protein n=1 Tax=Methylobrevis pamukkalensis TaxID=1439726 RepID=A0A1E3H379_9HYPH|nr:hypothetical protein A6302_02657 [Methylobrevis pamukkalensis]
MFGEKPVLGLVDPGREKGGSALVRMNALHQPSMGGTDLGLSGPIRKSKDLVRLLLAHGARARRATLPRTVVELEVFTPSGKAAVQISFKQG